MPTGDEVGEGIGAPAVAVEINRKKVAGLVEEHGIDSHDEVTGKMPSDDIIGYGKPILVGASVALDSGFFANTTSPFVAADRRISCLPGFLADEAVRVDFFPAAKKGAKKSNLFRYRRGVIEGHEIF